MRGRRRQFSAELKARAAQTVIESSRPIAQVARELGLSERTLNRWVAQHRALVPPHIRAVFLDALQRDAGYKDGLPDPLPLDRVPCSTNRSCSQRRRREFDQLVKPLA